MKTHLFIVIVCALWCTQCKPQEETPFDPDSIVDLKAYFADDFLMGAAINQKQINENDAKGNAILRKHYNSVTPENIMKCEVIHPQWDQYNFEAADKIVALAEKEKFFLVGHTLIWHSQLSPFVKSIKDKDSLKLFMENHIRTIAGRYAGKVDGWDVINEALEEDGSYRKSIFLETLGEDYITDAFRLAAESDPNAELYYNDYNIEQPKKRAGAINLIKKVKDAGLRIDGVGIQGHWSLQNIPYAEIEKSIIEYAALGLKVMITELDITVLPNPWDLTGADVDKNYEGSPFMNPYPNGLPDSVQTKLAEAYEKLFTLFLKYEANIDRITFWGVSDADSWLNNWPIKNRVNYPLLFDRNHEPKAAFYKVTGIKN